MPGLRENTLIAEDSCPVCRLTEPQTVRLEHLYDVLYDRADRGQRRRCASSTCDPDARAAIPRKATAEGSTHSGNNAFAQRIKDYIDKHLRDEFSLQQMADALHVSPYYLAHICKEVTGYSPQYVLRRRIGEAQTLLITTDLPVTPDCIAGGV